MRLCHDENENAQSLVQRRQNRANTDMNLQVKGTPGDLGVIADTKRLYCSSRYRNWYNIYMEKGL